MLFANLCDPLHSRAAPGLPLAASFSHWELTSSCDQNIFLLAQFWSGIHA